MKRYLFALFLLAAFLLPEAGDARMATPGVVAVMASYMGQVDVLHVIVPRPGKAEEFPQIADVTADFVYARIMGTKETPKVGYPAKVLDQWLALVQPSLLWQEEAQMESWSQPAEYIALEKLYGDFQSLNNMVRKAGGGG